jgi:hypothetical protein
MRRLALAAIGAVAVLVVGGVAFAQATGDERIYACVSNGDGTMRQVAGPDVACSKNWRQISWSAENAPTTQPSRYFRDSATVFIPDGNDTGTACVFCDNAEDLAVSGGFALVGNPVTILASRALNGNNRTGWKVDGVNQTGGGGGFQAHVVCLDFTP